MIEENILTWSKDCIQCVCYRETIVLVLISCLLKGYKDLDHLIMIKNSPQALAATGNMHITFNFPTLC